MQLDAPFSDRVDRVSDNVAFPCAQRGEKVPTCGLLESQKIKAADVNARTWSEAQPLLKRPILGSWLNSYCGAAGFLNHLGDPIFRVRSVGLALY